MVDVLDVIAVVEHAEKFLECGQVFRAERLGCLRKEGDFLSEAQHGSLNEDCVELIKLTSSIARTSRENDQ